jgi:hypothetical protein
MWLGQCSTHGDPATQSATSIITYSHIEIIYTRNFRNLLTGTLRSSPIYVIYLNTRHPCKQDDSLFTVLH